MMMAMVISMDLSFGGSPSTICRGVSERGSTACCSPCRPRSHAEVQPLANRYLHRRGPLGGFIPLSPRFCSACHTPVALFLLVYSAVLLS